jgi:outer membrane protein OmpA-like peptidoglycan-associated protein
MNLFARTTTIVALALAPFITGCATKKYVRTTVAPIEQKVGELDATTKTQAQNIEELERGLAAADERAKGAQGAADAAAEQAKLARNEAAEGRSLALKGLTRADELGKDMSSMRQAIDTRLENMVDYKLVTTEQVLFKIGKSELDEDAKAALDAAVGPVAKFKNYVVEVQGFTDSTGPKQLNLELSRKRADAVVRYLTRKHNLPLHRIYVAGYGADSEVADNRTREGRKLNRRVEMKVYVSADRVQNQISSTQRATQ